MLYNGIFGCQGNIYYVILINAFLQDTYYMSNQCVYQFWDLNSSSIGTRSDEFRKLAKIVCFIWRHVTQKRYAVHHGDLILLIGIWIVFRPILRAIGTHIDELRKYAKIVFYLTSCDIKTVRRTSWGHAEQFETNQKSLRLPVQKWWLKLGFSFILRHWSWHLTYVLSHALGMKYWHLHAKFHKNRSSINGWYALDTHTNTKHTPKVKSIVSQISSELD